MEFLAVQVKGNRRMILSTVEFAPEQHGTTREIIGTLTTFSGADFLPRRRGCQRFDGDL